MPDVILVEAVNLALDHAMREDENVVMLGEDVGTNGGVFRATDGLHEEFGYKRVMDTPLRMRDLLGLTAIVQCLVVGIGDGAVDVGKLAQVHHPVAQDVLCSLECLDAHGQAAFSMRTGTVSRSWSVSLAITTASYSPSSPP